MNYRKFLVALIAAGMVVVIVMFLIYGKHGHYESPYAEFLEQSKLDYKGRLRLRGEERIAGQDQFDRGMELYGANNFSEAAKALKDAVHQQPDSAAWWMYLGVCYYMSKDPAEAVSALNQANKLAFADLKPQIRWYLANAHLLAGARDPAEELLEALVRADGLYAPESRNLLARLRKTAAGSAEGKPVVDYPAGGERFITSNIVPVRWRFSSPESDTRYRIMLSSDGGITYDVQLAQGIPGNTNEWGWETKGMQGDQLCLRVDALSAKGTVLGVRSAPFSMNVAPWLIIESPSDGQTLRSGIEYPIVWKAVGVQPLGFSLELDQRSGRSYDYQTVRNIVYGAPPGQSQVLWKNDAPEGTGYRLKLTANFTDTTINVTTQRDFTIRAPVAVAFSTPESLVVAARDPNRPLDLSWRLDGEQPRSYTIELCDTLRNPARVLVPRLPGNSTGWSWNNRDMEGTYLVKITAHYPEGDLVSYTPMPVMINSAESAQTVGQSLAAVPSSLRLEQNYPNPFNSTTTIRFELSQPEHVKLRVYNSLGQLVKTLVDEPMTAGTHAVQFDASGLASGSYVYRTESGGHSEQKMMTLVR